MEIDNLLKEAREIWGNKGTRSKVGYVNIKKTMQKVGADLGGELAGHFFFKDIGYEQSTILVMLKVLKIVVEKNKSLADLIKSLNKYFNSGEINTEIESSRASMAIFQRLREKYKDGKTDDLDGITVEYPNWWFNLRSSNTEPLVRLVVEADTKELMEEKVKELTELIKTGA